jgi:hypothetical protein
MRGIRVAVWRGLVLACVLLALASCGGSSSKSADSTSTNDITTSPKTEGTGTESPGPTASGIAVSLPTLPVGGNQPDRTVHQCADVSWTGDQVIEGAKVRVTAVDLTPDGLFVRDDGVKCANPDCAASFSFTPSQTQCSVAVRATGTGDTEVRLTLEGSAQCATAQRQWCENLTSGAAGSVSLQQPPKSGQSGSSSDTSSPSPTPSS